MAVRYCADRLKMCCRRSSESLVSKSSLSIRDALWWMRAVGRISIECLFTLDMFLPGRMLQH